MKIKRVSTKMEFGNFITGKIEREKSKVKTDAVHNTFERLMEAESDIVEGRVYRGSIKMLSKKVI